MTNLYSTKNPKQSFSEKSEFWQLNCGNGKIVQTLVLIPLVTSNFTIYLLNFYYLWLIYNLKFALNY